MSATESGPRLVLTDAATPEDESVIRDGLGDYNFEKAGYRDYRPLAVLVSDPATGEVVGGLYGSTSMGLLRIDRFFLPESCGSRGLAAGSSRQRRKKERGAAAAGRCLRPFRFRRPAFTSGRAGRCSAGSTVIRPAIPGS